MISRALAAVCASSIAKGIGFALLSYAAFSTADALIKLSSGRFSVFQIAATLSLFAFVPVLAMTRSQGGWWALVPRRWHLVATRGVLTALGAIMAWRAFGLLPLSEAYAILFTSPILVTALSGPLLGERVTGARWAAAGVGFLGVMLMLNPDFSTFGVGHAFAMGGVLCGAVSFLVLRKIGGSEPTPSILTAVFTAIILASAPMIPSTFVVPTFHELGLMALAGLLMGCGQAVLVMATRDAPAAVVAPFQYTQMLWAVMFGAFLFGDRPTPLLIAGLGVVVLSGLYTIHGEMMRAKAAALAAEPATVTA